MTDDDLIKSTSAGGPDYTLSIPAGKKPKMKEVELEYQDIQKEITSASEADNPEKAMALLRQCKKLPYSRLLMVQKPVLANLKANRQRITDTRPTSKQGQKDFREYTEQVLEVSKKPEVRRADCLLAIQTGDIDRVKMYLNRGDVMHPHVILLEGVRTGNAATLESLLELDEVRGTLNDMNAQGLTALDIAHLEGSFEALSKIFETYNAQRGALTQEAGEVTTLEAATKLISKLKKLKPSQKGLSQEVTKDLIERHQASVLSTLKEKVTHAPKTPKRLEQFNKAFRSVVFAQAKAQFQELVISAKPLAEKAERAAEILQKLTSDERSELLKTHEKRLLRMEKPEDAAVVNAFISELSDVLSTDELATLRFHAAQRMVALDRVSRRMTLLPAAVAQCPEERRAELLKPLHRTLRIEIFRGMLESIDKRDITAIRAVIDAFEVAGLGVPPGLMHLDFVTAIEQGNVERVTKYAKMSDSDFDATTIKQGAAWVSSLVAACKSQAREAAAMVKILVEKLPYQAVQNALIIASMSPSTDVLTKLLAHPRVRLMANGVDAYGLTALDRAYLEGRNEAVAMLKDKTLARHGEVLQEAMAAKTLEKAQAVVKKIKALHIAEERLLRSLYDVVNSHIPEITKNLSNPAPQQTKQLRELMSIVKGTRQADVVKQEQLEEAISLGDIARELDLQRTVGGLDINKPDKDGRLPLAQAIRSGSYNDDMLKALLSLPGVDVDLRGKDGETALTTAIKEGNIAAFKILLGRTNVNGTNTAGETPLTLALQGLIASPDVETGKKYQSMIAGVMQAGGDLNTPNKKGETPFILMAKAGPAARELMRSLLDKEKDINLDAQDATGRTALMWLASMPKVDIRLLHLLYDKTQNILAHDKDKSTLLHIILRNPSLTKSLVEEGSGILINPLFKNSPDRQGMTPLELAAQLNIEGLTEAMEIKFQTKRRERSIAKPSSNPAKPKAEEATRPRGPIPNPLFYDPVSVVSAEEITEGRGALRAAEALIDAYGKDINKGALEEYKLQREATREAFVSYIANKPEVAEALVSQIAPLLTKPKSETETTADIAITIGKLKLMAHALLAHPDLAQGVDVAILIAKIGDDLDSRASSSMKREDNALMDELRERFIR